MLEHFAYYACLRGLFVSQGLRVAALSTKPFHKYHGPPFRSHSARFGSPSLLLLLFFTSEVDTMHLTTFVTLFAIGAAAAPAPRSTDMSKQIPTSALPKLPEITNLLRRQEEEKPASSSSSSSSASGLIGDLPSLPTGLVRRQEAEQPSFREVTEEQDSEAAAAPADPLDAYLETFDSSGNYDEDAQDAKLQDYLESDNSTKSESEPAPAPAAATPVEEEKAVEEPKAANATVEEPAAPQNETVKPVSTIPTDALEAEAPKNETVAEPEAPKEEAPKEEPAAEPEAKKEEAPKEEPAAEPQAKKEEAPKEEPAAEPQAKKEEAPKEEPAAEPEAKETPTEEPVAATNETASAAPTATSASTSEVDDVLGGLPIGSLPLKRQDLPLPEDPISGLPVGKRQAEEVQDAAATPAQDVEAAAATPIEAEKNVTSAANSTANATASEGFHGINKHLEKLNKLPVGLPIGLGKREAFDSEPAQPEAMPAAHSAPAAASPAPTPQGPPSSPFNADESSRSFRGDTRTEAHFAPTQKADSHAQPTGKPAGKSPLDAFLVPLSHGQGGVPSGPPSGPMEPAHGAPAAQAPPSGGKPSGPHGQEASPVADVFGSSEGKPQDASSASEHEFPVAEIFGEVEGRPERPQREERPQRAQMQGPPAASKPEPEHEQPESPFADVMGELPQGGPPSAPQGPPSASKPEPQASSPAAKAPVSEKKPEAEKPQSQPSQSTTEPRPKASVLPALAGKSKTGN